MKVYRLMWKSPLNPASRVTPLDGNTELEGTADLVGIIQAAESTNFVTFPERERCNAAMEMALANESRCDTLQKDAA